MSLSKENSPKSQMINQAITKDSQTGTDRPEVNFSDNEEPGSEIKDRSKKATIPMPRQTWVRPWENPIPRKIYLNSHDGAID